MHGPELGAMGFMHPQRSSLATVAIGINQPPPASAQGRSAAMLRCVRHARYHPGSSIMSCPHVREQFAIGVYYAFAVAKYLCGE